METDGGGWTVIQRRKVGLISFSRDWKHYKEGFGSIQGDFWLGNEHIYRLSQRPTVLRVELEVSRWLEVPQTHITEGLNTRRGESGPNRQQCISQERFIQARVSKMGNAAVALVTLSLAGPSAHPTQTRMHNQSSAVALFPGKSAQLKEELRSFLHGIFFIYYHCYPCFGKKKKATSNLSRQDQEKHTFKQIKAQRDDWSPLCQAG